MAAAGFPTRYRLEDFAGRYSSLLPAAEQAELARRGLTSSDAAQARPHAARATVLPPQLPPTSARGT